MEQGAQAVNEAASVLPVLAQLGADLEALGLLGEGLSPAFEVGAISKRELLQALRLVMPAGDFNIPLIRQGRGAQRLILVTVLIRLAQAANFPRSQHLKNRRRRWSPYDKHNLPNSAHHFGSARPSISSHALPRDCTCV